MTEEDAREMFKGYYYNNKYKGGVEEFIRCIKDNGYITRPMWEEAEEMYKEWDDGPGANEDELIRLLYSAMSAAVDRIKELEKVARG